VGKTKWVNSCKKAVKTVIEKVGTVFQHEDFIDNLGGW
jgi:hypothetical protein